MKYLTLDNIVKNVIVQLEESSLRRYQTYLAYAIRGYRFWNVNGISTTKIVSLPMLANKAVNLPSDYVKYLKVGICVNGRIITLGLDESLCIGENYNECGDPLEIAMANLDNPDYSWFGYGYQFMGYFQNGQYVDSMFGAGGGFNSRGYFRVNPATNQIQFTSNVPSATIVLEYTSDGIEPDGSAIIPVQAQEFMINWIHWKRKEADVSSTESEIARWERSTMIAFKNLKHFSLAFSAEEYLSACRENVYQTPKR